MHTEDGIARLQMENPLAAPGEGGRSPRISQRPRHMLELLERLTEQPSGGRMHQIVIGVIFASCFTVFGLWLGTYFGSAVNLSVPTRYGQAAFVDPSGFIAGLFGFGLTAFGLHLHAGWYWGLREKTHSAIEVARVALLLVAFVMLLGVVLRLAVLFLR